MKCCGLVTPFMASEIWINIGWGNGFLTGGAMQAIT